MPTALKEIILKNTKIAYNKQKRKSEVIYMQRYPIRLYRDENGEIFGECPIIKGCVEQGDSIDDAIRNITECIKDCLKLYENDNPEDYIIDYNSNYNIDSSEYTPIGIWEVVI